MYYLSNESNILDSWNLKDLIINGEAYRCEGLIVKKTVVISGVIETRDKVLEDTVDTEVNTYFLRVSKQNLFEDSIDLPVGLRRQQVDKAWDLIQKHQIDFDDMEEFLLSQNIPSEEYTRNILNKDAARIFKQHIRRNINSKKSDLISPNINMIVDWIFLDEVDVI